MGGVTRKGIRADLACGHSVAVPHERLRLAVDPAVFECPKGDGRQQVVPASIAKAKAALGM